MSPAPQPRASAAVRDEVAQLKADRDTDAHRVEDLAAGYDAVLLTGDDKAAEKHEAETAKLRRAIARAELRLPILAAELRDAEARDDEERKAAQRAEATAAVKDVVAEIEAGYSTPAATIAAFLARWAAASDLARAAGVDGPDGRLRRTPDRIVPAREQVRLVEVYPDGREVGSVGRVENHSLDPRTGEMARDDGVQLKKVRKVDHVPEQRIPGTFLGYLAETVTLPPGRAGEEWSWPAPKQAEPEAPKRAFGF